MAGAGTPGFYADAVVLLGAAVVAAPLFKRMGMGTVLGYLAAGVVIGPALKIITGGEEILQISELGVVFLLFVIGLELKPKRLWSLRRDIFGLGLAQVMLTGFALFAVMQAVTQLTWQAALVIGFGLALSSTAFALQIIQERGEFNTLHGRKSFSILLFQDLAIVPLLALIPLLAPRESAEGGSIVQATLIAIGAIVTLIFAGRYLLNPLFRIIGNTGAREAMIATALLVVMGSAYLMSVAGLSMALGAFIAGVMLAESSYRHELEADIEPFRGLLLGLFFMAIGLSLDLAIVAENWLVIVISVPVLMLVKAAVIFGLTRLFGNASDVALRTALVLPQGGEFGFVMFSLASGLSILSGELASILIAIVTLSMAATPLSVMLTRFIRIERGEHEDMDEDFEGAGADVLMIGFSRFGQIASQILLAGGSEVTIIDHSVQRVQAAGRFGFRIYFGDGTRREVLEAAGIHNAKIVAVCTNNRAVTDRIVAIVQNMVPDARIFVRAYDRAHSIELRKAGVDYEVRETLESGLTFGRNMLHGLGMSEDLANAITKDVRKRDEDRLRIQVAEGSLTAGQHMLHTRPVQPEPLITPQHGGKIINDDNTIEDRDKSQANAAR